MNYQATYSFFVLIEFIDVSESIFFYGFEIFLENFIDERNVTNFRYVYMKLKNFPGGWTKIYT